MKIASWFEWGGVRSTRPRPSTKLRLESLDQRVVPSGDPGTPPSNPPPAASPGDGTYTFDVQPGEWIHLGRYGGQDVLATVDHLGLSWLHVVDPTSRQFTARLLTPDTGYNPLGYAGVQSNFQPPAGNWNMVWNPDHQTWKTVAPGAVFTQAVSGRVRNGWNTVILPGANPPPVGPVNPPAQPAAGTTMTVVVNGQTVTITLPVGTSATVTPLPGGGVSLQITPAPPPPMPNPIQIPPPNLGPLPGPQMPPPDRGSPLPGESFGEYLNRVYPVLPVAPPPRPAKIPPPTQN